MLRKYSNEGEFMVEFSLETLEEAHYKSIGLPLVATALIADEIKAADPIAHTRSLIRHDTDIIAKELVSLCRR
jgi:hypothetical protein